MICSFEDLAIYGHLRTTNTGQEMKSIHKKCILDQTLRSAIHPFSRIVQHIIPGENDVSKIALAIIFGGTWSSSSGVILFGLF